MSVAILVFTIMLLIRAYIATTDACLCNMDADVFRAPKTWYRSVFEGDISDGS